jgi:Flp pilus assembly protein TadD
MCACAQLPPGLAGGDALSADEHYRMGEIFEAHGLPSDAAAQYERAASLKPKDPRSWMALGNIQFKRGNYARAARYYRRVLKVSPDHAAAENNLAMTYLARNKDLGEAERLVMAALKEDGPLKPYLLDTLSGIYDREGRLRESHIAAAQAAEAQAALVQAGADSSARDVTLLPSPGSL